MQISLHGISRHHVLSTETSLHLQSGAPPLALSPALPHVHQSFLWQEPVHCVYCAVQGGGNSKPCSQDISLSLFPSPPPNFLIFIEIESSCKKESSSYRQSVPERRNNPPYPEHLTVLRLSKIMGAATVQGQGRTHCFGEGIWFPALVPSEMEGKGRNPAGKAHQLSHSWKNSQQEGTYTRLAPMKNAAFLGINGGHSEDEDAV